MRTYTVVSANMPVVTVAKDSVRILILQSIGAFIILSAHLFAMSAENHSDQGQI
jgi:hypothetical protein